MSADTSSGSGDYAILLAEPGEWELEIAGSHAYVIDVARALGLYIRAEPSSSSAPSPATAARKVEQPAPPPPPPPDSEEEVSVDEFYESYLGSRDPESISPEDQVVIFGYYLENYMDRETWGPVEVTTCFTMAGLEQPRNLMGILSTMAKQKQAIQQEAPGEYCLTDRSNHMVGLALGH